MGEDCDSELCSVCEFYGDDLDKINLESQLKVLRTLYFEKAENQKQPSIRAVKQVLQSLTQSMVEMGVCKVFQLLIIMPATNSTSEWSFSALRRIKSYLRSSMSQARMNHLMMLHYHQAYADSLDMKQVANEFISVRDTREAVFAKYT